MRDYNVREALAFWDDPYAVTSINNIDIRFMLSRQVSTNSLNKFIDGSLLDQLLPSQIDFQHHCQASRKLMQTQPYNETAELFRLFLEPQYRAAESKSIAAYWYLLTQIDPYYSSWNPGAAPFRSNVWVASCYPSLHKYDPSEQRQQWYTRVSLEDLNLTESYQSTVKLWDNYLNPLDLHHANYTNPQTNQSIMVPGLQAIQFFRPLLPERWRQSDNIEAGYALGRSTMNPEFLLAVKQTVTSYAPTYCRSLDFAGNADLAGKGVTVSYGLLAGFITLLCIYHQIHAVLDHRRRSGPTVPSRLQHAISKFAPPLSDTALYFNITTCLSGAYYSRQAQTVYEFDIGAMVVMLTCSSVLALVTSGAPLRTEKETPIRDIILAIGLLLGSALTTHNLRSLKNNRALEDFRCYHPNQPQQLLITSVYTQFFLWTVMAVIVLAPFPLHFAQAILSTHQDPTWKRIDAILASVRQTAWSLFLHSHVAFMWIYIAFIIVIRQEAQKIFGDSYQDNWIGYGQVFACGICVQPFVVWVYYFCTYEADSWPVRAFP